MLEPFLPPLGVACAGVIAWAIRRGVKHLFVVIKERGERDRTLEQKANDADRTEGKLLLDRFTVLGEQQESFTEGLIASTRRLSQAVERRDRQIEGLHKDIAAEREEKYQLALDLRSTKRDLDEANAKIGRLQARLDGYAQGRVEERS